MVNRSRKELGWCTGRNPKKFLSFEKDRKTKKEKCHNISFACGLGVVVRKRHPQKQGTRGKTSVSGGRVTLYKKTWEGRFLNCSY